MNPGLGDIMAMILSIEIDNCNFKIIEASKKGETLSVRRCMSINIPYGIKNGKIIDMDLAVKMISEALKKNNIKAKRAVFVINSNSIRIRTIKLPLLKKNSEILSMIQIELQQFVSVDLNNYKISYEIKKVVKENKISYAYYTVYCIPMVLVNQYTELAEKLNLKRTKIDIPHFCINRLYKNSITINNNILDINETTAFVNVREDSFSFSVADNGFCDFYFSSGFERNPIERVAEPQSLYMFSEGYPTVEDTIEKQLIKLMRYYYSVSGNRTINMIFIYGICDDEVLTAIKTKLNVKAEIIGGISCVEADNKYMDIFEINKYFHAVIVLLSKNKEINLTTRNKKIRNKYGYVAALFIIVAALVALIGFINSQHVMRAKIAAMSSFIGYSENNELNKEIENIKNEADYLGQYLNQAEELQQQIDDNDFVDSDILRKIYVSKPSDTKLTSIYSNKDSTQLQCVSSSVAEVTLFFSNLREIEQVERVYIPAIQSKTGQSFSYSVILKLKDVNKNDS